MMETRMTLTASTVCLLLELWLHSLLQNTSDYTMTRRLLAKMISFLIPTIIRNHCLVWTESLLPNIILLLRKSD